MKKTLVGLSIVFFIQANAQKKWSLQECISYAQKHNLQVMQNQLSQKRAEKDAKIAKNQKLPAFAGNFNHNLTLGQSQDIFGNNQRNDNYGNNVGVNGSMTLYNHGQIKKNEERAQYNLEAAGYDVETIKNNISLQIVQEYLQILLNKEIAEVNKSAAGNSKKLLEKVKITTQVGTTPRSQQAEAEANLARDKQRYNVALIDIKKSLFNLALLLQLENYKDFDIEGVNVNKNIAGTLIDDDQIIQNAYQSQPQIKSAATKIIIAQKQEEIAKTAYYPTVSLSSGLSTFYYNSLAAQDKNDLFKQYSNNFSQQVGLGVTVPIFNKGITKLQVEQSRIDIDIAKNSLEQQKLQLKQNVQKSIFDARTNYENYQYALEAEKSSAVALDFAQKSYEAGKTTIYELNTAKNNYIAAKSSLLQAQYNYLFSLKLLDYYQGNLKN